MKTLTPPTFLDWTEIERHFGVDNATTAVYPLFEGATLLTSVANSVLVALDEHRAALHRALTSSDKSAHSQLLYAHNALEAARVAFLDSSCGQGESDEDATQMLRDLEAAWQSHLLHAHPATP